MGWAAEYCAGRISETAPSLKVQLRITAANGDSFSTDPEEFVPDSIKASPGCYLLRGALPLTDLEPGPYKVSLTISGAENGSSYNLVRDFEVKVGRGLVCLALTEERCRDLDLPLMVEKNTSNYGTAFTVSIEARGRVTTGISAHDRSETVRVAIDPKTRPADLLRPGHIFPLRAKRGGVLK
ncbi:MAG: 3,4-dihydroxy-2-butanone-4-phosphate synthase, partial [Candidatus Baltobacteraceae bacterium]